jgi:ferredoxin
MSQPPAIVYRGKRYPVRAGEDILSQLLMAGADIQYLCMGGTCGTCRIQIKQGAEHIDPIAPGEKHFIHDNSPDRLACQAICRASGDVEIDQEVRRPGVAK